MSSLTATYHDCFATNFSRFKTQIALIPDTGESISYGRLDELIDMFNLNVAREFHDEVDYKKLFFVLMDNSLPSLVSYLFCLKYGHVALLLSPDSDHLGALTKHYQPNGILRSQDGSAVIECCSNEPLNLHPDLAILLSTSGSTGSPKQVRLSRQNIQENAASICEYLSITADERAISALPPYYSYGLSVINSHLLAGASIVLTNDSIVNRTFWDLLNAHSVTSFAGVPYTYDVLNKLRFTRMKLPSLRYMTQAGGRLSKALVELISQSLAEQGKRFYVMYGQTEATARMAYLPANKVSLYPNSIGHAIPGGSFHLIDEKGLLIDQENVTGELVYKGPNVMMGYASSIEDLALSSELTELKTGDMAYRNDEGLYFIVGRCNRIIKVFGVRIDLDELEKNLCDIGVPACAVEIDDKLVLVVNSDSQKQGLSNYMTDTVKLHPTGFSVSVLNEIPRTLNGKVNYVALKNMLAGLQLNHAQPAKANLLEVSDIDLGAEND